MKKGDLYIGLVIIILLALLGVGYKLYTSHIGAERYVQVSVNDKVVKSVKLTKGADVTFTVLTDHGQFVDVKNGVVTDSGNEYNVIHVFNNGFQVIEADCPHKDDVRQGFVDKPLFQVICVPHHLSVEIVGDNNATTTSGLDGVAN